jgi:uncharacterized membrane protein
MQEENISGEESLAIIESMINKAKNQFSENGFMYLLWGWVILFCSLAQFILKTVVDYPKHYLVWMLTWVAVLVQIIYLSRRERRRKVKTYTDDIVGYVWMTFVILMMLTGFLIGRSPGIRSETLITIIFLALYGMPTFLSGIILKFRPLVIGGICCWVLTVGSVFVSPDYRLLFLAAAVVIAWIIPGYLLRARYRQENN